MFNSLYSVVNWTGIATGLMYLLGLNWLGQRYYAMAVITVNIWRGLPFFAITILAVLAIPRSCTRPPRPTAPAPTPASAHHAAAPQAGARGGGAVLDHLHLQRLQHRLVATDGGPDELHPPLRHAVAHDRHRHRGIGEGAAISLYLFPLLVFVVWAQLRFVREADV